MVPLMFTVSMYGAFNMSMYGAFNVSIYGAFNVSMYGSFTVSMYAAISLHKGISKLLRTLSPQMNSVNVSIS